MHLKQKDEKIFTEKILLISHRSMAKMTSECIGIPSIETRREDDRYFFKFLIVSYLPFLTFIFKIVFPPIYLVVK